MKILYRQGLHLLLLVMLLAFCYYIIVSGSGFYSGSFLSVSSKYWFWATLDIAILHQIYVLLVWRSELYYHKFTKLFGTRAFKIYAAGFAVLGIGRVVATLFLAISNAGTADFSLLFRWIFVIVFTPVVIYLFYSVRTFFTFNRALGIDHFKTEEARNWPMVKKGIFKYTSNSMYTYGFMLPWIIAIAFDSKAALLSALFQHLYIWVHYFTTEKPDMEYIYGGKEKRQP